MKLTRKSVERAANALRQHANDENADARVFVALADEWLAQRSVAWGVEQFEGQECAVLQSRPLWRGCLHHSTFSVSAHAPGEDVAPDFYDESNARAWLEAKAEADGFTVER